MVSQEPELRVPEGAKERAGFLKRKGPLLLNKKTKTAPSELFKAEGHFGMGQRPLAELRVPEGAKGRASGSPFVFK